MASYVNLRLYNLAFEARAAQAKHPDLPGYPTELVDADLTDSHDIIREVLRRKKVPVAYMYMVAEDAYKVYCLPEDKP